MQHSLQRDGMVITGDGSFQLLLTPYDTTIFTNTGTGQAPLPSIIREAC